MKRFLLTLLLILAAPLAWGARLYGKTTVCAPDAKGRLKQYAMLGLIIKVKWQGGTGTAETDKQGRYQIDFPDGVDSLEVFLNTGELDMHRSEHIKVRKRIRIRMNWDLCNQATH